MLKLAAGIHHLAVIAPAGRSRGTTVTAAVKWLRDSGITVSVMPGVEASIDDASGKSASLKIRLADIYRCWDNPAIDLVWCIRGGYGSGQLLSELDWDRLRARDLPLLGYSDITALQLGMLACRVGIPVCGPTLCEFRKFTTDRFSFSALAGAIHGAESVNPLVLPSGIRLKFLREGLAEGALIPANLSLLNSLLGTPFIPDLHGAILLLEEVNEELYQVDRLMTQLKQAGIFEKINGLIFGRFMQRGRQLRGVNRLFAKFADEVSGPVIVNFPFGHCFPRFSFRIGRRLKIYSDRLLI